MPRPTSIGGTTAAARNIISGNADSGVQIYDANDNLVEGNYIGTDKTGTVALGNNQGSGANGFDFGGVTLDDGSSGNTIGGLTATPGTGAGNLISGNTFAGVLLYYAGSDNLVAGNLIGTDVTGTVALGNLIDPAVNYGGAGVGVEYSPDTTVGEPGGRNVISGNGPGTVDGTNVYLLVLVRKRCPEQLHRHRHHRDRRPLHQHIERRRVPDTGRTRSADSRRRRARDWATSSRAMRSAFITRAIRCLTPSSSKATSSAPMRPASTSCQTPMRASFSIRSAWSRSAAPRPVRGT